MAPGEQEVPALGPATLGRCRRDDGNDAFWDGEGVVVSERGTETVVAFAAISCLPF